MSVGGYLPPGLKEGGYTFAALRDAFPLSDLASAYSIVELKEEGRPPPHIMPHESRSGSRLCLRNGPTKARSWATRV